MNSRKRSTTDGAARLRVLSIDPGFTTGWAVIDAARAPLSGSFKLPGSYEHLGMALIELETQLTKLVANHFPTVIGYAEAFIRQPSKWDPKNRVKPENLVPLFAFIGMVEKIAYAFSIECVTVNEPAARHALMGKVPRKTKDIKYAALVTCKRLGWPACDGHAADALVVGDYVYQLIRPGRGHERAPLFGSRK